jgi:filamentous hemagglutinin family protein
MITRIILTILIQTPQQRRNQKKCPQKQLVNHSFLYLIAIFFFLTYPTLLYADISTDGTVGAAQTLTGPDYTIPETLGTLKGDNLFHSFEKFSIKTQETATFTGSDSIKNVISRVTGGEKSEIDGTLRSNVDKADFYFINPNGVVFGQNAKVDVPAAFHVSTSDELKFKDGSSFKASKSENSTLTQAAPESFGFLGTQSASIEINGNKEVLENRGSIEINASNLEFKPESKISLTSSKDITIHGNEEKFATLENVEGEIQFRAKGGFVMDKAIVAVGGDGGGNVSVKASNAKLKMAAINADNIGNKDSDKGVDIEISNKFELSEVSSISSSTWSDGDAGYVKINSGNIKIDGSGIKDLYTGIWCNANSSSTGNAGDVEIYVSGMLEIINGARIASSNYPYSKGNGGNINIIAGDIRIDDYGVYEQYTGIWSDTYPNSEGNAGKVEIKVAGSLEILNGGQISSDTYSEGNAKSVKVIAEDIKIDNQGSNYEQYTGIWSDAVNLGYQGDAGIVEVTAFNSIKLLNEGRISSDTYANGNAGNVIVNTDELIMNSSGYIESSAYLNAKGYVGNILINSNYLNLSDNSFISIQAYQKLSEEQLNNIPEKSITINSREIRLNIGSDITSKSIQNVPASSINIDSDKLIVSNSSSINSSANYADGGDITMNVGNIYLNDGLITTSVFGTNGDGGNISINEYEDSNSSGFLVMQNGLIKANTKAEGSKGGKIRINKDTLLIADKSMPFQIGGEPEEFSLDDKKNIIQAADPLKNPQDIEAPTVPVDLGSSLVNSGKKIFEPIKMAENYCRLIGTSHESSLIYKARGGFVEMPSNPSSIFYGGNRLDELMRYQETNQQN